MGPTSVRVVPRTRLSPATSAPSSAPACMRREYLLLTTEPGVTHGLVLVSAIHRCGHSV